MKHFCEHDNVDAIFFYYFYWILSIRQEIFSLTRMGCWIIEDIFEMRDEQMFNIGSGT